METYQDVQTAGVEILNKLYQNSWRDPEFKERLIGAPSATIEEIIGHSISPDKRFIVEDQSDESIIYFNIPAKPDFDSLELTDEQLEAVSGGDITLGTVVLICGVVALGGLVCYGAGVAVGYLSNKH